MNYQDSYTLNLGHETLTALPGKALWWDAKGLLVVSDLHLGKSERMARRSGRLPPPYESMETLDRLEHLISILNPAHVLCLGDSFDDTVAMKALPEAITARLERLTSARRWTWIIGNHDPGPVELGGACLFEIRIGGIAFRHIADATTTEPEVSGHYHPKASVRGARRPAFVTDGRRLIMPAFGTYTGGLDVSDASILSLMGPKACAILTGPTLAAVPLAACARPSSSTPARWARGLG